MQSLDASYGNHFSGSKPPNCHFPSLSPTIEGDGGQQRLERKSPEKAEIWKIFAEMAQNYHFPSLCRNHWGRGHLVAQSPKKRTNFSFAMLFDLLCIHFYYCHSAISCLEYTALKGKRQNLVTIRLACATFPDAKWLPSFRPDFHPISPFQIPNCSAAPRWITGRGVTEEEGIVNWNLMNWWIGARSTDEWLALGQGQREGGAAGGVGGLDHFLHWGRPPPCPRNIWHLRWDNINIPAFEIFWILGEMRGKF